MTTSVLAVDDSVTMRRVLEITFAGEDYQTILADSGADALAKLRAEQPAIALVDAQLGSDSGYDLCEAIKRESPGTAVVILSSKQQPYDRARGSSVGADDFMDKPFDTQQMLDKVGALLRKAAEAPAAAAVPAAAPAPYRTPAAPIAQPHAPAPAAPAAAPLAQRPRSPTLSYGTPAPAPVVTQPAPASAPRAPTFTGTPAPAAAHPAPSPHAPMAAPTPVSGMPLHRPAAAPAPAPAPAAAVATAAASATNGSGDLAAKLSGLGLDASQVQAVLALSREVVEQVVWEVVPVLAETIIKEEIRRLTTE